MRALILPAVALALAGGIVLVGGRMVEGPPGGDPVAVEAPDAETIAAAEAPVAPTDVAPPPAASSDVGEPAAPAEETPPAAEGTPASGAQALRAPQASVEPDTQAMELQPALPPSRTIDPTVIAPPELAAGEELLREAPREPLSQLSLALPPPPPPKNPWAGKPLFRPVALESAVFESGGHTIAIDGVESVALDESCTYEGTSWPCGVRARTAFRFWLRGRALVCQIPEAEQDKEVMRASCRLAKQDVGAWLVSNGWALATPGGPYVQAEETARAARMGIFGAPPDTSSIADVPDAPASAPTDSPPIMTEEGVDPQPSLGLEQAFPPAPQP
ncbi:thermonuclease family protein [Mesorhizobium sp. YM1C-6-2]|uniref:thermonuclease family protein n=1 Tax=Mesorhizobium sp. YM1C-6-2 TaxID=1827501 RepID=UPI0016013AE2|nr:thermonuclease family protein [Mesorhizobium sp. YM1C-6-2]